MDRLPNELLNDIFMNLHFFQKQECMLVCRKWSNIIGSTCLLSSVVVSEKFTFERLAQMLNDNPLYRFQIQSLIIQDKVKLTLKEYQFLHHFPNLRFIHVGRSIIPLEKILGENVGVQADFNNWKSQIEIVELRLWKRSRHDLLFPGVLLGLKQLAVNCHHFGFSGVDVITDAPNINNLTVIGAQISIKEFESLCNGLKELHSLTLKKTTILISDETNSSITANSIRTLFISFQYIHDDTIVKWLQYITRNCLLLVNFRFIFPWTSVIKHRHEENITNNGIVPLLQNLGDQLKYLDISISTGIKSALHTLQVQSYNIQKIHIRTLFSGFRREFESIGGLGKFIHQLTIALNKATLLKKDIFKNLTMLKSLTIGYMNKKTYGGGCIMLNDLLDSCPTTLESLEIYDFEIYCYRWLTRSYSLRKLAIHGFKISKSTHYFISGSLPCLRYLTIDQKSAVHEDIVLNGNNLYHLNIYLKQNSYIAINTHSGNITRYYHLDRYTSTKFHYPQSDRVLYRDVIEPESYEDAQASGDIVYLTCNSVNTLIVNDKLAF